MASALIEPRPAGVRDQLMARSHTTSGVMVSKGQVSRNPCEAAISQAAAAGVSLPDVSSTGSSAGATTSRMMQMEMIAVSSRIAG